jgi:hypothetical protein
VFALGNRIKRTLFKILRRTPPAGCMISRNYQIRLNLPNKHILISEARFSGAKCIDNYGKNRTIIMCLNVLWHIYIEKNNLSIDLWQSGTNWFVFIAHLHIFSIVKLIALRYHSFNGLMSSITSVIAVNKKALPEYVFSYVTSNWQWRVRPLIDSQSFFIRSF